ncbi:MAG TPA: hypothetical protein VJ953_01850, partial [Saprospiraceae bacterium]|nr:hypothetical protein [Saprospiraceae bacterium]
MRPAIVLLCCFLWTSYLSAQVTLTRSGRPMSRMIVDTQNATDSTAAALLQRFVAEMSGARLPVIDYREVDLRTNDILIGAFQRTDWTQPPALLDSLVPDGFLLDTHDGYLRILSGGDKGS